MKSPFICRREFVKNFHAELLFPRLFDQLFELEAEKVPNTSHLTNSQRGPRNPAEHKIIKITPTQNPNSLILIDIV